MIITALAIALTCNQACHEKARNDLYEKLYSSEYMQSRYIAAKDEFGLTFNSREKIAIAGAQHSLYHLEVEGPQIVKGARTLRDAGEWLTPMLAHSADPAHKPENPVAPGVGLTVTDINGFPVAIFDYQNKADGGGRSQSAILFAEDRFYLVTMTSHTDKKPDPANAALIMLLIDMVNSGKIPGISAPNNSFKPSPLRGLGPTGTASGGPA